MVGQEVLRKGRKVSKGILVAYAICIIAIVGALASMYIRVKREKPNAIDFTENDGIGIEADKYAYMQVEGLTNMVAWYGSNDNAESDDNQKYYIAINNNLWYLVNLSNTNLNELKDLQAYTAGETENKPVPVTIYGVTEKISPQLKRVIIDYFKDAFGEENEITSENFEDYFGSMVLNVRKEPVGLEIESVVLLLAGIMLFVVIICHISNAISRHKVTKYLRKNGYERELIEQLEDNVEANLLKDKLIITKDYVVDTTPGAFIAVRVSDIKWMYTHTHSQYYRFVKVSSNSDIILNLKDGKNVFTCARINGDVSDELKEIFDKIARKVSGDTLIGYTNENMSEFKQYKKDLKKNVL